MKSMIILIPSKHIICYKMCFWKLHECGHTNCPLMIFFFLQYTIYFNFHSAHSVELWYSLVLSESLPRGIHHITLEIDCFWCSTHIYIYKLSHNNMSSSAMTCGIINLDGTTSQNTI